MLESFHFLRPQWLLLIPLCLALAWLLTKRHSQNSWGQFIAKDKLPWLLQGKQNFSKMMPIYLLLAWIIACISLAGPSWEKVEEPLSRPPDALVILMDLSPSMLVADLVPNRLLRAKLKLTDLLGLRKEGQTALVAYSGDAHIVSPLTTDAKTMIGLLNTLHPDIMPSEGSNVEAAIQLGNQLLKNSNIRHGHLLLVTDGLADTALETIQDLMNAGSFDTYRHRLSILGIGTSAGGPIPDQSGGFLKDSKGKIILAQLNRNDLETLAATNQGRYIGLQIDNGDLNYLLDDSARVRFFQQWLSADTDTEEPLLQRQHYETWKDRGAWLVLLLLPLALFVFRKNWLLMVILAVNLQWLPSPTLAADTAIDEEPQESLSLWNKLWLNPDQQGQKLLRQQAPKQAAKTFDNLEWQAYSQFQAKDYQQAEQIYRQLGSAQALLNTGKSLFNQGDLAGAIEALKNSREKAIENNQPELAKKADEYRQLLDWMQQKADRQNSQQQGEDSQEGDQQNSQQQGEDSQEGDQQNSQQQQADSQEGDQQNSQQQQADSQEGDQQNSQQQQADSQEGDQQNNQQQQADSQEGDQQDKQQQLADSQEGDQQDKREQKLANSEAMDEADRPSEEAVQALHRQRWLETIPDDPGGLLRRKFKYQSQHQKGEFQDQKGRY